MIPRSRSSSANPIPLSAIIPTLDEEGFILTVLGGLALQGNTPAMDVILADGGSSDRTVERFGRATAGWTARGWSARVVRGRPGRAAQMNAGAREAVGEVLVFLHADTRLPPM